MKKRLLGILLAVPLCLMLMSVTAHAVIPDSDYPKLDGGSGTLGNPYVISTKEHLIAFRNFVNQTEGRAKGDKPYEGKYIQLTQDLDLTGEDWDPIGNEKYQYGPPTKTAFYGIFDGNSHTISGLNCSGADGAVIGLFGNISGGATVKRLNVTGTLAGGKYSGGVVGKSYQSSVIDCTFSGNVTGSNTAGGVVGYNHSGTVSNCTFSGNGNVTGSDTAGGMVGNNDSGTVTGCTVNIMLQKITGKNAGGVVGSNSNGTVELCSANNGTIQANSEAGLALGGVVGYNSGTVKKSWNLGCTVDGANYSEKLYCRYAGGVVGQNAGTVENCYFKGIGIVSGKYYVGGVVGHNGNSGTVKNCYETSKSIMVVNSEGDVPGRVIGRNEGTVENCYFLKSDDSSLEGIGSGSGSATAKTEAQFKSGEVTWWLNGATNQESQMVWYQYKVDSDYPTLEFNSNGYVYAPQPCPRTFSNTKALAEVNAQHEISHTVEGDTITQHCSLCSMAGGTATITRDNNVSLVYTGEEIKPFKVVVSNWFEGSTVILTNDSIVYKNNTYVDTTGENPATATLACGEVTVTKTFNIQRAPVTVTGIKVDMTKVYDGTTSARIASSGNPVGYRPNDTGNARLFLKSGTASYDNKNVGENKTITFTGFVLQGPAAYNYTLTQPAPVTGGSITPAPVTITGTTVADKTYDGTATATITNNGSLSANYDGGNLTITRGSASFDNKNAGDNKTVTFTGFALGGSAAGNYELTAQPASTTANISRKSVTIVGATAELSKTYDGNTGADKIDLGTLSGKCAGDDLYFNAGEASYDNKNVGENKTIYFTGFRLRGADVDNYELTDQPASLSGASISKRNATATVKVNDKTYDGTDTAMVWAEVTTKNGLVAGDLIDITGLTGTFENSNAGDGKRVTIDQSSMVISGADAGNYNVDVPTEATGNIKKAASSVDTSPVPKDNLIYNGTEQALVTAGTATGGTMQYALSETGTYSETIPVGTDADTYTVWYKVVGDNNHNGTEPVSMDVTIAPKSVTVSITANGGTYDGTIEPATARLDGVVDGENVDVTLTYTGGSYNSTVAPTNAGTYTVTASISDSNYSLTGDTDAEFVVQKANSTLTDPVANNLVYNGNDQALVTAGTATGGTMQYSLVQNGTYSETIPVGKDAGTYTVWYKVVGDSNHNDTEPGSVNITITPKSVTVSGISAEDKPYDGNTTATLNYDNVNIVGIVTGDTLTVSATGTFEDAAAGDNKTVTITDLTLTGTDAGNYVLATEGQQTETTASITAASLTGNASVTLEDWTYGDTPKTPVVTGNDGNGAVTYQYKAQGADDSTYSANVPTEAGDYTVKATIAATANYQAAEATDDFTIATKELTVSGLTATAREYDGTTEVTLTGGELVGIVGNDDVKADMPTTGTITEAGAGGQKLVDYGTITLTGEKKDNYFLTQPEVSVTISQAVPDVGSVIKTAPEVIFTSTELDSIVLTNTGSAVGTVKLNDGQTLKAGENYYYDWTFTPDDSNYKNMTGIIRLTVVDDPLTGIEVTTQPSKTTYTHGDQFDTTGMIVTATYLSGATKNLASDAYTVLDGTMTMGKTTVTLSYQGKTCTVEGLTVNKAAAQQLSGITVRQRFDVTAEQSKEIGRAGMPDDAGNLTYAKGAETATGNVTVVWNVTDNGTVTYALSDGAVGDTVTLPITIGSENYADSIFTVTIVLTAKNVPTATANDITVTYTGAEIPASDITGTAEFDGVDVPGSWSWKNTAPKIVADSNDSVVVVFTPDDANEYETVEDTIKVTINKATPTGSPACTAINSDGKTLANANLAVGTITPDGTIAWDDGENTTVIANAVYDWTFTPTDTDNYTTLTGMIMPYVVSDSGGGNGGGESGGGESGGGESGGGNSGSGESGGGNSGSGNSGSGESGSGNSGSGNSGSGNSGSGESGSGESGDSNKEEETNNGDVDVSDKDPEQGDKVIITPKPDDGYEVDDVVVTDQNGNPVEVTDNGDGTYSFIQPAGKVTITVTFKEKTKLLFVDVFPSDYYYDAVYWAVDNGITKGTSNTTFSPNVDCTRAQIVTFLWRAAGSPAPKSSEMPFTDVLPGSYYYDAVMWAVENGITKGTSDTVFGPNGICSRGEIVTFLWRAAGSPDPKNSMASFTDVASDVYYANAVAWAAENGITGGTGDGMFSPNADCTRAQIVTFLYRYLGNK